MKKLTPLSIIIINFNTGALLSNCLKAILEHTLEVEYQVIIIDNASTDDSLFVIPENNNITIVKNKTNKGFGKACNQGVNHSNSEYVLFLNPDAEVRNNTIKASLKFMMNNPSMNVMGCKQVDENGNILRTCSRFITLSNYINKLSGLSKILPNTFPNYHMHEWNHSFSKEVDHVMGSYYLMRRKDFLKIGLFDESYFVYLEDIDLSYRVKQNKGKVYFNAEIEIYHETGGSSKNVKAKRLFYSLDSLLIYGKKHFSATHYYLLFFLVLFIEPLLRLIFNVVQLDFEGSKQTIVGYNMLYKKNL